MTFPEWSFVLLKQNQKNNTNNNNDTNDDKTNCHQNPGFPSRPFMIRAPLFPLFGVNEGTQKEKVKKKNILLANLESE